MGKLSNTTKILLGATIFSLSSHLWANSLSEQLNKNNNLTTNITNKNYKQIASIYWVIKHHNAKKIKNKKRAQKLQSTNKKQKKQETTTPEMPSFGFRINH